MISLVLNIYRLLISVHGAITHRFLSFFFVCMLSACSTLPPYSGKIAISTTSLSQPVTGASCEVRTDAGKWTIITPAIAPVGQIAGDLHVVCELQQLNSTLAREQLASPSVIVIGDVFKGLLAMQSGAELQDVQGKGILDRFQHLGRNARSQRPGVFEQRHQDREPHHGGTVLEGRLCGQGRGSIRAL